MKRKLIGADVTPKCEYCKNGIPSPDGKHILCFRMGILDFDFSCKKFSYDVLKRTPRKPVITQEFSEDDFHL